MKEIKDYLHLYLGCEIKCTGGHYEGEVAIINGVTKTHITVEGSIKSDFNVIVYETFYNYWKPILRPLSDMTLDEMAILQIDGLDDLKGNLGDLLMKTTDFLMLLHWGFDIFDLIPAGLAIDKTLQTV